MKNLFTIIVLVCFVQFLDAQTLVPPEPASKLEELGLSGPIKEIVEYVYQTNKDTTNRRWKTIPLVTGNVNVSIENGTMECDFILKDMPRSIANDYVIRINAGMNIHSFKDLKHGNLIYYDNDLKDTLSSGESIAYFFPGNHNKGRFLPEEMEIKYVGKYPVADSARGYMVQDWRGNVAFNGYSLRADGYQSAWYPILFDLKKQAIYNKVRYDVKVNCADCTTLFMNGSKPVTAKSTEFKSDIPQEMLLYCGNYKTSETDGTWILNPDMDKAEQVEFLKVINGIKNYYVKKIGMPFKTDITFIQTTPTADKDHAFLFVSYPTILNVGVGQYGLNTMFDKKRGEHYKSYLAHELAHYYFGETLHTNTPFGDIVDESFAEFMSMQAVRDLGPDSVYKKLVDLKLKSLAKFKPTPIAAVKSKNDLSERQEYVYTFVPVILTAIEKEIGNAKMWLWLKTMAGQHPDFTDYAFFERTFNEAIGDEKEAARIKEKYFSSADAVQHAVDEINEK